MGDGVGVTISVVLRLVDSSVRTGRIAGEVEVVTTGQRQLIGDVEDLVSFLLQIALEGDEMSRASWDRNR